jgi:hypothetical protein
VNGLAVLAPDDVWAVGQGGIVMHFDGVVWKRIDAGITKYLQCVRAFAHGDVWVGGEDGISHYDGSSWQKVDPGFTGWIVAMAGTGPEDLWVATDGDILGHRTATGWTTTPSNSSFAAPWDMHSFSPTDAWAAGPSGYLRHWDGNTWTAVPGAYETYSVWGAAPDDVWIGGTNGYMYHWDGGTMTTSMSMFSQGWFFGDIWGTGPGNVWAAGSRSVSFGVSALRLQHWDGGQWNEVDPLGGGLALHGSGASDIWMAGRRGMLQHWNGSSWSAPRTLTTDTMMGIWAASDTAAFAVDSAGRALRWNGSAWTAAQTPATFLAAVSGTAADDVWGVGTAIVHFDGQSWSTLVDNSTVNASSAVWPVSRTEAWTGGDTSFHRHFVNGTPEFVARPSFWQVNGMWGSSSSDVWAVGATAEHWNGSQWTTVDTGNGSNGELLAIWGSSASNVWAVGRTGKIVRYNGLGWSVPTSPTTDDLRAVWGAGPNEVYVAAFTGKIWVWNGSVWTAQDSGAGDRQFNQINGLGGAGTRVWAVGDVGMILTRKR